MATQVEQDEWVHVREAAAQIGIAYDTLLRKIRAGKVRRSKVRRIGFGKTNPIYLRQSAVDGLKRLYTL